MDIKLSANFSLGEFIEKNKRGSIWIHIQQLNDESKHRLISMTGLYNKKLDKIVYNRV